MKGFGFRGVGVLLFVFGILFPLRIFGNPSGKVSGKNGNLHPPEEGNSRNYNNEKLMIIFNPDCAIDYNTVKKYYKSLIKDLSDCLYEDTIKHSKNIYYIDKTQSYHGYIMIKNVDCVDNININYDDYCILEFDYEEVFIPAGVSCTSESPFLWNTYYLYHTDIIDGLIDNTYNYVTDSNNIIDIYILDTGVLSTHDEFNELTVTHLDLNYNDNNITESHGTNVASILAGSTVGVFKHGINIYSYTSCPTLCPAQDVEDGLNAVINKLETTMLTNPNRRSVINLSYGGFSYLITQEWYESYFDIMINNGGIPVCCAGNYGESACNINNGQIYNYNPCTAYNCICVGGYDENMNIYNDSDYGECVDVYGPGVNVLGAASTGDSDYLYFTGTSQATPAISGLAANLLYINNNLTFTQIYRILTNNSYATDVTNCPNDLDEGNCNGIGMTCNQVINAANNPGNENFYRSYLGYYYAVCDNTQSFTFNEADLYCQIEYGTNLASFHDIEHENDLFNLSSDINNELIYGYYENLWIGLNDINNEAGSDGSIGSGWEWIDGTSYDYIMRWATNKPNNKGDCVDIRKTDNKGNDRYCGNEQTRKCFLCNSGLEYISILSENNNYIGICNSITEWEFNEAELYCNSIFNTNLASIHNLNNENEIILLADILISKYYSGIWIGLNDINNEAGNNGNIGSNWEWTDGTLYDYVVDWYSGDPNSNGDCCVINREYKTIRERECDDLKNCFICNY